MNNVVRVYAVFGGLFIFQTLLVIGIWSYSDSNWDALTDENIWLRNDNAIMGSMINDIPGGVIIVDVDGGIVRYANRGASELIGFSQSEMMGVPIAALQIMPDDAFGRILQDAASHRSAINRGWVRSDGLLRNRNGELVRRSVMLYACYSRDDVAQWRIFFSPLAKTVAD